MKTYRDCECGAYRIQESGQPCEVCTGCEGRLESMRGELELAHNFHNVAVAERNHARHLLGEVLAVLNGDGGHAVEVLGWNGALERGLARYHELRKRADCLVMYPCDCTYPRDGQPDFNCTACHGLGAVAKTEMK